MVEPSIVTSTVFYSRGRWTNGPTWCLLLDTCIHFFLNPVKKARVPTIRENQGTNNFLKSQGRSENCVIFPLGSGNFYLVGQMFIISLHAAQQQKCFFLFKLGIGKFCRNGRLIIRYYIISVSLIKSFLNFSLVAVQHCLHFSLMR